MYDLCRALCAAVAVSGCVSPVAPPVLNIPAKDQEVPVVVAIGPINTTGVVYDGQPVSPGAERDM
jgi:hypothetical protein